MHGNMCLQFTHKSSKQAHNKICTIFCRGNPEDIFEKLKNAVGISRVCFEQDCEPVWTRRDTCAKEWCVENNVEWIECVGHTLWDPQQVNTFKTMLMPVRYILHNIFVYAVQYIFT